MVLTRFRSRALRFSTDLGLDLCLSAARPSLAKLSLRLHFESGVAMTVSFCELGVAVAGLPLSARRFAESRTVLLSVVKMMLAGRVDVPGLGLGRMKMLLVVLLLELVVLDEAITQLNLIYQLNLSPIKPLTNSLNTVTESNHLIESLAGDNLITVYTQYVNILLTSICTIATVCEYIYISLSRKHVIRIASLVVSTPCVGINKAKLTILCLVHAIVSRTDQLTLCCLSIDV